VVGCLDVFVIDLNVFLVECAIMNYGGILLVSSVVSIEFVDVLMMILVLVGF